MKKRHFWLFTWLDLSEWSQSLNVCSKICSFFSNDWSNFLELIDWMAFSSEICGSRFSPTVQMQSHDPLGFCFAEVDARLLARKSTCACPLTAFRGRNYMSYWDSRIAHFASRPFREGLDMSNHSGLTFDIT